VFVWFISFIIIPIYFYGRLWHSSFSCALFADYVKWTRNGELTLVCEPDSYPKVLNWFHLNSILGRLYQKLGKFNFDSYRPITICSSRSSVSEEHLMGWSCLSVRMIHLHCWAAMGSNNYHCCATMGYMVGTCCRATMKFNNSHCWNRLLWNNGISDHIRAKTIRYCWKTLLRNGFGLILVQE
jgi:hypothetical protein